MAYLPDSDRGQLHIKNVDDPATYWRGAPPVKSFPNDRHPLMSDGVGSGLHLDDEPEEIFPLPALQMALEYTEDVPGAVDFLTRYKSFWGGCNVVLYDRQKRSVAIEKCSHNFIEVFPPDRYGRSHCSGMTCRDPNSPQGRYQQAQRQKYLQLFGRSNDCSDNAFWAACRKFEEKLAAGLLALGEPARFDDVARLFITPWPEGLNKNGLKLHPEQGLVGYTLITRATLIDERKVYQWQRRVDDLMFPCVPEVYQF